MLYVDNGVDLAVRLRRYYSGVDSPRFLHLTKKNAATAASIEAINDKTTSPAKGPSANQIRTMIKQRTENVVRT